MCSDNFFFDNCKLLHNKQAPACTEACLLLIENVFIA